MSDEFYKIGEFSKLVGVSPSTVRRWEQQGYIFPTRTPSNTRLFSKDDLATALGISTDNGDATTTVLYVIGKTELEILDAEDRLLSSLESSDGENILVFHDIAEGSTDAHRMEFRKMMRLCAAGGVHRVVCLTLSDVFEGYEETMRDWFNAFEIEVVEVHE